MVGVDAGGMRVVVEPTRRLPAALERLNRADDDEVRAALARLLDLAGIPPKRAARIMRCDERTYALDLRRPLPSIATDESDDTPED